MSLLTPTESHAFQSFLASIDRADHPDRMTYPTPEWAMYGGVDLDDDAIPPQAQGREALAKATKDLMSLDPHGWNSSAVNQHGSLTNAPPSYRSSFHHPQQQMEHSLQTSNSYSYHQQHLQGNDARPFSLHKSPNQSHPQQPGIPTLPPIAIAPRHTIGPGSASTPPLSTASSSSTRSTSSTPTPATTPPSPHHSGLNHDPLLPSAKRPISLAYEHEHRQTSHKRPRPSPVSQSLPMQWQHPSLNTSFPARSNSQSSGTQPTRSNTHPLPHASRSNGTSHTNLRPPKPTLLSPSQKKANHIQSEQKRRANIRKGYEALCETVPALREALREEEMRGSPSDLADVEGKEGKGRGRTKRGRGRGKSEDMAEKVDGRAGPRSENVVLSKSECFITINRSILCILSD